MEHLKAEACSNNGTTGDLDPVVTALLTQETFDRTQMAWLMSLAGRWGYEARVDEENHGWPEPGVFAAGDTIKAIDQRAYRRACDAAAGLPRPGDYRGGPVAWDDAELQVAA
jgi:hypothetical protein